MNSIEKHNKKANSMALKFLMLSFICLVSTSISAYDALVDGIYYNIDKSSKTAEVTYNKWGDYSGKVIIPSNVSYDNIDYRVSSIGDYAFRACKLLSSINLPNSIRTIGKYVFWDCFELTSVDIPYGVISIGERAFYNCTGLKAVSIPKSVKTIDQGAFENCTSLVTIEIPEGVTAIKGLFAGCYNLTTVSIPNTVTTIGKHTFQDCYKLNKITIPNSVKYIEDWAFYQCGLTSVSIPNGVVSIGYAAFCYSDLTSVIIPASITAIGSEAFYCSDLVSVKVGMQVPISISSSTFRYSKNATLYVPKGSKKDYESAAYWKDFKEIVEYEVESVKNYNLSISSSGSGYVSCLGYTVSGETKTIPVNEGTSATFTFTPNSGYRIGSLKVNNLDVTSSVSNNKYTINSINCNTTVSITFEAIPPTTYTLSITSSGNGSVTYSGNTFSSTTRSYTVNEGTSATLTFTPNSGYRVGSLKVNNVDVTSSVSNNKYTISSINRNTTVNVTFEAIPPTTYTLSITSSANGSVSCSSYTISGGTKSFPVNEGSSATLTLTPNSGYRVGSLKVNSVDVTSSVSNNKYTISSINRNITVSVTFEAIPPTTYTMTITSGSGGYVTYLGNIIVNDTKSYNVNEGSSATLTFTPNSGYRVGSLKVNNVDVTSSVSNNKYTISSINRNTTVSVTFEAIPSTTYTLSITSSGNGFVSCSGYTISGGTKSFPVNEGASATLTFTPNSGYRIGSLKVNNVDVTSSVSNNKYTISSINRNTTVSVTFEAIPSTTYTLSIISSGSGSVSCSGYTISNGTKSFSVNEGASATLTFTPNNGYRIESLKVNNVDVTSSISNNKFTISSISRNITVSVTFEEIPISFSTLAYDGVVYRVISNVDKTVNVTGGNYSQSLKVMKVPANFYSNDVNWQVKGIDSDVITSNPQLAAVIWNPTVKFDATVSNPNFLLYVTNADYAPSTIKNVIVNGTANSITLTEATSGNDFYCPEAFTARSISYAHNYMMTTGIGESQGWETIALPFDVQTITHSTKGEIIPFAKWSSGASRRPFWLYELTSSGWREASAINAYTPYIISMPNNDRYYDEARLNGNVTFSATNVRVEPTSAKTAIYQGKTFTPNFTTTSASASIYALNVKNQWTQNTNSQKDGSTFVQNLRTLHPFEAYISSENSTRSSFPIFEDMTTGIRGIADLIDMKRIGGVYNLKGQKVKVEVGGNLPAGIYIINGQKVIVK